MNDSREKNIERRMGTCRHYNVAIRNSVCDAGVTYPKGPLPCVVLLSGGPRSDEQRRAICPKFEGRSREDVEREYDEMEVHMAKTMRVLAAVRPWRTWTRENRVGKAEVIECPECKGKLHLSQSAYNGHVHGKCETADCVMWME
jgi:hypothetical protein